MPRIYVPSRGPNDWRLLLADPEKHWKEGRSAWATAMSWELASGFPNEIQDLFHGTELEGAEPLVILPEHRVNLPGGARPSQCDVWVLARTNKGLASISVEGKAGETFGPTVGEWSDVSTPGRQERIAFLQAALGLRSVPPDHVRYQLLHRTAAAVLEARRFHASMAVMVVQSFAVSSAGFDDYAKFAALFNVAPQRDRLAPIGIVDGTQIFIGWVDGDLRKLEHIKAEVTV